MRGRKAGQWPAGALTAEPPGGKYGSDICVVRKDCIDKFV